MLRAGLTNTQCEQSHFFSIFMEDTALPEAHWIKALDPKWWRPLSTEHKRLLETGPTTDLADQLVATFPAMVEFEEVIFACTYGKSRSVLAAEAFKAWLKGPHASLDLYFSERNPWWHALLVNSLKRAQKRPD